LFWLVSYLGVALTGIKLLMEHGFVALSKAHKSGDYGPMLLMGGSILLLALTIQSYAQYFRGCDEESVGD